MRIGNRRTVAVDLRALAPLLLALAPFVGCAREVPRESGVVEVPRPKLEEGLFPVAAARVDEEAAPARFAAELPATVAAFRAEERTLPHAFLRHRLCAGEPEVVARFGRAVEAAASAASGDELRESYGTLLAWCGRPEMCEWTRAAVERGGALAEVAWVGLAQCPSAENDLLFDSGRAPARQQIEYWSDQTWFGGEEPRYRPALVPALRRAVELGDAFLVRRAALLVGADGHADGAAALVALHRELPEGDLRDALAVGLADATSPEARAIFEELCARPGRREPLCDGDDALEQIVELPAPASGSASEEIAIPDATAKARLEQLGLLWRGPHPAGAGYALEDEESTPEGARGWLVASGPVHCFDVETGEFPNGHDALLFELAELAGPPLADALFVEEAPPLGLGDGKWLVTGGEVDRLPAGAAEGDPYRVTAYLGGRSFAIDAQDFGDWYDLDQTIGLLNAMAIDRGAEIRLVVLPGESQIACVLAAPRAAILAGVASGALELGEADAARASGQAFEAVVLEKLEKGEIDLGAD